MRKIQKQRFLWKFFESTSLCILLPFVFILTHQRNIVNNGMADPCNFGRSMHRGSTNRDVILLSADTYNRGLEVALKSIRSAGCLSRIVILSEKPFNISNVRRSMLNALKVEINDNMVNVNTSRKKVPHMIRYEFEQQWIEAHINELDRVFHSDAFDVFFQKDPFDDEIQKDRLMFVVEPHKVKSCPWNYNWIATCYGEKVINVMKSNFIICSGSIIGGAKPYLQFLDIMLSQKEWTSCWDLSLDQPIVNYLVWNGILRNAGIKYNLTGCNGNFLTMQWCVNLMKPPINKDGFVMSQIGYLPAFIHQYNRNENLLYKLQNKCIRAY